MDARFKQGITRSSSANSSNITFTHRGSGASRSPPGFNILIIKSTGISFLNCINRNIEKGRVRLSISICSSISRNSGIDSIIVSFSRGSESTVKGGSSSSSFSTGLTFMLALAASSLFDRHGIKSKLSTDSLVVAFSLPLTQARVVGRHCRSKYNIPLKLIHSKTGK